MTPNIKQEDTNESKAETPETNALEKPVDFASSQVEPPPRPPLPLQLNQDFSILNTIIQQNNPLTPVALADDLSLSFSKESLLSLQSDDVPPKVHPRKKSLDKRSSIPSTPSTPLSSKTDQDMFQQESSFSPLTTSQSDTMLVDSEQTMSVKERKQMFNRMASESDVLKSNKPNMGFGPQVCLYSLRWE